ncbi:hypothetical protein DPMN_144610 [Dreissena polymorpha]|uniref:Uncharacterized protein n=1 Tax=Dreissena polymorpha TaxID=45954 RepID=A0A9D4F761_DREPO|nr:hypothetical protein DPMN_144610 [Dreissena polymorpha]
MRDILAQTACAWFVLSGRMELTLCVKAVMSVPTSLTPARQHARHVQMAIPPRHTCLRTLRNVTC